MEKSNSIVFDTTDTDTSFSDNEPVAKRFCSDFMSIPVASLHYAPKNAANLFKITINLRNYSVQFDHNNLYDKLRMRDSQLHFIVSLIFNSEKKTKYRSGKKFKILLETIKTEEKRWKPKKVYFLIYDILRDLVGPEQEISSEDLQISSREADFDKFEEIEISHVDKKKQSHSLAHRYI